MSHLPMILIAAWVAGLAALAGGWMAWLEERSEREPKREIPHAIIAFGGGILTAAVAFALLPHASEVLSAASLAFTFCAGGLFFCVLDATLSSRGGTRAQFMAMLVDFLPEALALGALFEQNRSTGLLLAAFIGAQNLPEGFNSYRELRKSGSKRRSALLALFGASLAGPLAALSGYLYLRDETGLTAGIMAFASGGILYLVFQDIAPQAKMKRHWTPTLGAVLGFAVGLLGHKLIG